MKYLICLLVVLAGCKKQPDGMVYVPYEGRAAFSTNIYLGRDSTYYFIRSTNLVDYYAYLSTCGTQPSTEAPNSGVEVYQLSGPTQTIISWTNWTNFGSVPAIQNLEPGVYRFVGHAWVTGYRTCDSTLMNDHAYDTITLTILKRRTKVKLN